MYDPPGCCEKHASDSSCKACEFYDRLLRTAAEFANYKKRTAGETETALHAGREAFAKELLSALDNLDRALEAVGSFDPAATDPALAATPEPTGAATIRVLAEGVELVAKSFHAIFEKYEIKVFDPLGEMFDPALHEAVQKIETDVHPPRTILKVHARGYTARGKLLRPAMVAVAARPALAGG